MTDEATQILEELEKLENAIDRLVSDKKVLGMELETRDKQISELSECIRSSKSDVGMVKERIAKLLLDKK